MVSINSCLEVDLYGQVSSESAGTRQISGTGGQLDFLTGASTSRGGKAFICMSSTFTDRNGMQQSRVVPRFGGDIITSPRSQVYYLATEYGVVNLIGKSTWERQKPLFLWRIRCSATNSFAPHRHSTFGDVPTSDNEKPPTGCRGFCLHMDFYFDNARHGFIDSLFG